MLHVNKHQCWKRLASMIAVKGIRH